MGTRVRMNAPSICSEQCLSMCSSICSRAMHVRNVTVLTKELLTFRSNSYVGKRARRAEPISLGWQGIGGA